MSSFSSAPSLRRKFNSHSLSNIDISLSLSLCQGSESEPRHWSTRLIFLIMFVASLLLFNVFSASYTSFLSVVQTAQPFSTIQELEATDYKVGGPPGSAYKINFEVGGGWSSSSSDQKIYFVNLHGEASGPSSQ